MSQNDQFLGAFSHLPERGTDHGYEHFLWRENGSSVLHGLDFSGIGCSRPVAVRSPVLVKPSSGKHARNARWVVASDTSAVIVCYRGLKSQIWSGKGLSRGLWTYYFDGKLFPAFCLFCEWASRSLGCWKSFFSLLFVFDWDSRRKNVKVIWWVRFRTRDAVDRYRDEHAYLLLFNWD